MPDGRQGGKAYAVLQRAITEDKVVGLAQALISNREQVVLLWPVGRLRTISILLYYAAVRPAAAFDDDLPQLDVSTAEVKLARTLIDVTRARGADLDEYRNLYNDQLEVLIQSKISAKEIATAPSVERGPPSLISWTRLWQAYKRPNPGGLVGKDTPGWQDQGAGKRRKSG